MLHGATVRSTIARGTASGASAFPEHIPWHEFTIVTAADIPGRNMVPMFLEDQPLLVPADKNARSQPPRRADPAACPSGPSPRSPAAVAAVEITYDDVACASSTVEEAAARSERHHLGRAGCGRAQYVFKSFLLETR